MNRVNEDFSKRLGHFGISKVGHDHIHISSPIVWDDKNQPFHTTTIKTDDLDEIKRLLGVHDSSVADAEPSDTHKYLANLSVLPDDAIYDAASAYVFGNSNLLKHHKAAIENKLGVREIQVVSANTMKVDSVIIIDGTKAIVVDTLIFENGGQIKNVGVLTLNAGQIINKAS